MARSQESVLSTDTRSAYAQDGAANRRPDYAMNVSLCALIIAFVFILRAPFFGSPSIFIDEQFYLVVADRWVHAGALPFVDIWDRKPIGIFAIFAAAVLLFKDPIIGYQLMACLTVCATCLMIYAAGPLFGGWKTGFIAALSYAVAVMLMEGGGGQTAVFYNLLILAGAVMMTRLLSPGIGYGPAKTIRHAVAACLLFGLALQVKYTCVVETAALSLFLLSELYLHKRLKVSGLCVAAFLMALAGLLPTILVGAVYVRLGHWNEFFYANFDSIFQKHLWSLSKLQFLWRLGKSTLICVILLPVAAVGFWDTIKHWRSAHAGGKVVVIWIVCSFLSASMLGSPNRVYYLSTLAPLAFLVGAGFQNIPLMANAVGRTADGLIRRIGERGVLAAFLVLPVIASFVITYVTPLQRGERADVYAMGDYLRGRKADGCLFVFNRLPILYYLSQACYPSKYVFPNHLSEMSEVRGVDGEQRLNELKRVLAERPATVFVRLPYQEDLAPEAAAILEAALARDYVLGLERSGWHQVYRVYFRKPVPPNTEAGKGL